MSTYWRENEDGTRVRVDNDPRNDWSDGYRAGRRYARKRQPATRLLWFAFGMAAEFLLLLAVMGAL